MVVLCAAINGWVGVAGDPGSTGRGLTEGAGGGGGGEGEGLTVSRARLEKRRDGRKLRERVLSKAVALRKRNVPARIRIVSIGRHCELLDGGCWTGSSFSLEARPLLGTRHPPHFLIVRHAKKDYQG